MQPRRFQGWQKLGWCLVAGLSQGGGLLPEFLGSAQAQPPGPLGLPEATESTRDKIRETGGLTVAIRSDSPIFGYINADRQWTGYCFDLVQAIETSLEAMDDMPDDIEVEYVASTLANRYQLVQAGLVDLECGPNTIRNDIEGVAFSVPFFYTGTQFLVTAGQVNLLAEHPTLAGIKIGVASPTTNEQFLRQAFPGATLVTFESSRAGQVGLQGLMAGTFEGYASDSILLRAALASSELPEDNFRVVPEQPLTCDGYGLILPGDDEPWQRTIGTLLQSEPQRSIQSSWLGQYYPLELATLEHCLGVEEVTPPPVSQLPKTPVDANIAPAEQF